MDLTLAAALRLRTILRGAGVIGMPGVRILGGSVPGDRIEIVIEDRAEAGDEISESRGIRFYADQAVAALTRRAVLDLDGSEFVVRPQGSA